MSGVGHHHLKIIDNIDIFLVPLPKEYSPKAHVEAAVFRVLEPRYCFADGYYFTETIFISIFLLLISIRVFNFNSCGFEVNFCMFEPP